MEPAAGRVASSGGLPITRPGGEAMRGRMVANSGSALGRAMQMARGDTSAPTGTVTATITAPEAEGEDQERACMPIVPDPEATRVLVTDGAGESLLEPRLPHSPRASPPGRFIGACSVERAGAGTLAGVLPCPIGQAPQKASCRIREDPRPGLPSRAFHPEWNRLASPPAVAPSRPPDGDMRITSR